MPFVGDIAMVEQTVLLVIVSYVLARGTFLQTAQGHHSHGHQNVETDTVHLQPTTEVIESSGDTHFHSDLGPDYHPLPNIILGNPNELIDEVHAFRVMSHKPAKVVNDTSVATDPLDDSLVEIRGHVGTVHVRRVPHHHSSIAPHELVENTHIDALVAVGSIAFTAIEIIINVEVTNNFCAFYDETTVPTSLDSDKVEEHSVDHIFELQSPFLSSAAHGTKVKAHSRDENHVSVVQHVCKVTDSHDGILTIEVQRSDINSVPNIVNQVRTRHSYHDVENPGSNSFNSTGRSNHELMRSHVIHMGFATDCRSHESTFEIDPCKHVPTDFDKDNPHFHARAQGDDPSVDVLVHIVSKPCRREGDHVLHTIGVILDAFATRAEETHHTEVEVSVTLEGSVQGT